MRECNLQPAVQRGEGRRNSERESAGVRGRARGRRSEGRRGSQEEEVNFGKKKIYQNLNVEDSSSILHTYIYIRIYIFADWSSNLSPIEVAPFVQPTGPAVTLSQDPIQLFSLFFTPELIMSIVVETNRYANVVNPSGEWKTNQNELQHTLGFIY